MNRKLILTQSIFLLISIVSSACGIKMRDDVGVVPHPPTATTIAFEVDEIDPSNEIVDEAIATPVGTEIIEMSKPISFYHMGNFSGKGAEYINPWIFAFDDMVSSINSVDDNREAEIETVFLDTEGEIENAVEGYQMWVSENKNIPFIVLYEPDIIDVILPLAQADEIPILSPIVSNSIANSQPEFFYGFGVSYESQFEYYLTYLAENWESLKPRGAEDQIYLAYFGWEEDDDFQGLTDRTRAYAESLNIVIQREAYFFNSPIESMSDQVMRAQWAASNYIYANFQNHGGAILVNDIYRLGLQLVFGVAMPYQSLDINTYAYLGYDGYLNNIHSPFPYLWWSDQNSEIVDEQLDLIESQNGLFLLDGNQSRLIMAGMMEVMQIAIENMQENEVKITGENFDQAISQLSSDDIDDPIFHFDFTKDTAQLSEMQIRKVTDRLIFEIENDFSLFSNFSEK